MTGLIPSQHGVHSFLDPKFMMGPEAYNTLAEFTSLGEVLRDAGYVCGLSGQVASGREPHADRRLFVLDHEAGWAYAGVLRSGGDRGRQGAAARRAIRRTCGRSAAWSSSSRTRTGRSFLFLAYNGPYSLGKLMLNPSRNRHAEYYADKELPSFPRDAMHPWQFANKQFHNNADGDAARGGGDERRG